MEQLHAGEYYSKLYKKVSHFWHTNSDGNYWIGYTPHNISPEDLYLVTMSTIADLMKNHPDLIERVRKSGKSLCFEE
jgi:hypothetical protein